MIEKRKRPIYIVAVMVVFGLIGWIVMLYVEKDWEERSREQEFLVRYDAAFNDILSSIGHFEEVKSFEEQSMYLEELMNNLSQLRAYMEMHMNLLTLEGKDSGVDRWFGETEVYRLISCINHGGTIDSCQIEAFRADGIISEGEAAVIRLLREDMEILQGDMRASNGDGGDYQYVISSVEVYRRLTEVMQNIRKQMMQVSL